jgi:Cu(I)/Ag(I) efflux system membrane fusion protein
MSTPAASPAPKPVNQSKLRGRVAWLLQRLLPLAAIPAGIVVLIILVGLAQRAGWIGSSMESSAPTTSTSTIFTCPMHPQIRQPSKGRCPICGMELVPASSGAADLDEFAVKIEPAQRRLANIQTAPAVSEPLEATLQTVGAITVDESRQATIAAYIDGRLERLFADYTGVDLKSGDHLAVLYSPQLYGAQVEYLEARKNANTSDGIPAVRQAHAALAANTRQRLSEFGVTDQQMTELERTNKAESRLTIYTPQSGTVVEKLAVEGNYVKAGDPIYRIAELSTVWLLLKLFPEDASRIRFGQRVEATVQSFPGEVLLGRVAFIDPTVDQKTRTVNVRVELLNEDRRLRPGDYANATIRLPIGPQGKVYDAALAGKWISPMHPQVIREEPGKCPICGMDLVPTERYGFSAQPVRHPESLSVPRQAVLMAGGNSVVYAETKPGLFEIRPVTLGPVLRDRIVILNGLKAGEQVATAGNFLIDSQMQLAGKPSLIDPKRAAARSKDRKGPLSFDAISVKPIGGKPGEQLESLYAAYLEIQQALAADKPPPASAAQQLQRTAKALTDEFSLPTDATNQVKEIASHSEHLHHLDLKGVRKAFKPISHAVVTLAAQVRGENAASPLTHFYCPMVPGGGGDWLQKDLSLLNPYFGSEMLRCGEKVRVFPTQGKPPDAVPQEPDPATPAKVRS